MRGRRRTNKVTLLEEQNPKWEDLSREWYSEDEQELLAKFRQPGERRD